MYSSNNLLTFYYIFFFWVHNFFPASWYVALNKTETKWFFVFRLINSELFEIYSTHYLLAFIFNHPFLSSKYRWVFFYSNRTLSALWYSWRQKSLSQWWIKFQVFNKKHIYEGTGGRSDLLVRYRSKHHRNVACYLNNRQLEELTSDDSTSEVKEAIVLIVNGMEIMKSAFPTSP